MSSLFVTGSGTEVGKTLVMKLLIKEIKQKGLKVDAFKPVITGFQDEFPKNSDTGLLLQALSQPIKEETISKISPWRFREPISPNLAAAHEKKYLDIEEIANYCNAQKTDNNFLIVEGIGGVMVPLNDHQTVLDLMAVMDMPVLLVTGSYLGTISHTLTAVRCLIDRGLMLSGIIVSESIQTPTTLAETVKTISRFVDSIPIISLPRLNGPPLNATNLPKIAQKIGVITD